MTKNQAIKKARAIRAAGGEAKVFQIVRTFTVPFVGIRTSIDFEVRIGVKVEEVAV